jgi:phosphatidylinositol-3-phosphatase
MKNKLLRCLVTGLFAGRLFAAEGAVPSGVPHLDHVFVIVMENHGYNQIVGNPNAPFANWYMHNANSANNYFAVGHPSLTNYLEIVGGSNFGVRSDNNPDWHNATCTANLALGTVVTDNPPSPNVCPIFGSGTDAETPIIDHTNECSPAPCNPGLIDVNGTLGFRAAPNTSGKTIADQLAERGMTWKSYQESLPPTGADNVNFSDGFFTDSTNIPAVLPGETQTLIKLYAAKHNPFVYFRSVQEAEGPGASLKNVTGFMGAGGLYEDLEAGTIPAFSLIAPNQCNDQHGRGNAGPQCDFDPLDNGAPAGLNPALIYLGDLTLRNVVNAIHASPVWKSGKNAIVVVWDENDYSLAPTTNQVPAIVETNFSAKGVNSANFYTHFSLLRTLEGGLGLPCLNHACDSGTKTMSDLFGGK